MLPAYSLRIVSFGLGLPPRIEICAKGYRIELYISRLAWNLFVIRKLKVVYVENFLLPVSVAIAIDSGGRIVWRIPASWSPRSVSKGVCTWRVRGRRGRYRVPPRANQRPSARQFWLDISLGESLFPGIFPLSTLARRRPRLVSSCRPRSNLPWH